jgi:hypothetical protein
VTAQEEQLISDLARQIQSAPPPQIDGDADHLIRSTIGTRPDALYILVQTVLMQQMALNQQQPSRFLPDQPQPPQYQDPQYPPQYQQPHGGMFSNFLHNAAATAAGVIAGDVVFDSLASIFGGHRGGGGGGFFGGSNFMDGGDQHVDQGGNDDSQFASVADRNQDISPDIDDERDA